MPDEVIRLLTKRRDEALDEARRIERFLADLGPPALSTTRSASAPAPGERHALTACRLADQSGLSEGWLGVTTWWTETADRARSA